MTTATTTPALPMGMEGVKERPPEHKALIHERYDLSAKLNDLQRRVELGGDDPIGASLLTKQVKAMKRYLWCLDRRLDRLR